MWAKIKAWFYKLIGRKTKVDEVFGLEVFDETGDKTLSVTSDTAILSMYTQLNVSGVVTVSRDYSSFGSKVIILRVNGGGGYSYTESHDGAKITIKSEHPLANMTFHIGVLL